MLGYHLYLDLRRGWRITSPNLEQCGLLKINYQDLPEACEDEDLWQPYHEVIRSTSTNNETRIVSHATGLYATRAGDQG